MLDNHHPIIIKDLGRLPYLEAWEIQKSLFKKRMEGKAQDTLLLVEHDPVYTLGKNADAVHLLESRSQSAQVIQVDRGGDVTWHGPGQIVGYPILDLRPYNLNVKSYVNTLEEVIIRSLDKLEIKSQRKQKFPGVWVGDEKIAALGVKISRRITMHGFALNVHPDLSYYSGMIPCGISEFGITSIEKTLKKHIEMERVKEIVANEMNRSFSKLKDLGS